LLESTCMPVMERFSTDPGGDENRAIGSLFERHRQRQRQPTALPISHRLPRSTRTTPAQPSRQHRQQDTKRRGGGNAIGLAGVGLSSPLDSLESASASFRDDPCRRSLHEVSCHLDGDPRTQQYLAMDRLRFSWHPDSSRFDPTNWCFRSSTDGSEPRLLNKSHGGSELWIQQIH